MLSKNEMHKFSVLHKVQSSQEKIVCKFRLVPNLDQYMNIVLKREITFFWLALNFFVVLLFSRFDLIWT
jgi:hypothetical protein